MKKTLLASLLAFSAIALPGEGQAQSPRFETSGEVLICARNMGVYVARAKFVTLVRPSRIRHETGWRSLAMGDQTCIRADDVRQQTITIEAFTGFNWAVSCNVTSGGRSVVVMSGGTTLLRSCAEQ